MKINFRIAEISDTRELLRILSARQNESNKLHGGNSNPVMTSGESIFHKILKDKNFDIVVGQNGKKIISTLTIYRLPRIRQGGYFAIIEDVLVDKKYRDKGYGKQMMKYAISLCKKDKRIRKIKLGTRKDNKRVHKFYENLDFKYTEKLMQLPLNH